MTLIESIKKGESKTLQFKEALPKNENIAKTVIAFSNTSGGKLIIGVNDERKIVGIDDTELFELQDKAFIHLVEEENLSKERTQALIEHFLYSEKEPMRDDILDLLEGDRPTLLQRKIIGERILRKIVSFVDVFVNGKRASGLIERPIH